MKSRSTLPWLPLLLPVLLCPGALGQVSVGLRITNISFSLGNVALGWNTAGPTLAYTVQSRDALSGGIWINAPATAPWPTLAQAWTDARPVTAPTRFYRVVGVPTATRGKVLSSTLVSSLSQSVIAFLLATQGASIVPQFAVNIYKLDYETVDPVGARTQASGALVLPVNPTRALPLLSYQHGTLVLKTDAPSANTPGEVFIGVAFAATGYAAAVPDYLGMGDSPGLHPYHHAQSEATACVDMLRAARLFCASNQINLNNQLFICGYSQGGHATMALQRELETYHASEFTITASAPMAGAYDLSGATTADFLSGRSMPNPYYFSYLLAAYQSVYHLTNSFADLLTPPYSTTLPSLFDGQHSSGAINAAMPANVTLILKPELLAAFKTNLNHPLRVALRDNDVYAWAPRSPTHLYQCSGDQDVAPANATVALSSFQTLGATSVQFTDPLPGADHGACVLPALLDAKQWFDSLKQ